MQAWLVWKAPPLPIPPAETNLPVDVCKIAFLALHKQWRMRASLEGIQTQGTQRNNFPSDKQLSGWQGSAQNSDLPTDFPAVQNSQTVNPWGHWGTESILLCIAYIPEVPGGPDLVFSKHHLLEFLQEPHTVPYFLPTDLSDMHKPPRSKGNQWRTTVHSQSECEPCRLLPTEDTA